MYESCYDDVARDFLRLVKLHGRRPDAGHLAALTRAFGRLPYENLTKIVRAAEFEGEAKVRTPEIVLADHIDLGTGGTCFSLTFFFKQVLEFAGFDVHPVLGDRSYGPDTHCALIARLPRETSFARRGGQAKLKGERYLVDPGYLLEAPLQIPRRGESTQRLQSSSTRLVRPGESGQLLLFTERGGARKLRYRLKEAEVSAETFRRRWIDSFGWAMMRHVCVSRQTESGQLFMRDGMLRRTRRDEKSQGRIEGSFASEVSKAFGIDPRVVDAASDCVKILRKKT